MYDELEQVTESTTEQNIVAANNHALPVENAQADTLSDVINKPIERETIWMY